MTDFFTEFDAERWHFTYVDENDHDLPVQQVGIVAIFSLVDAYFPARRKGIAEAFSLYKSLYGDKIKGGYRADKGMTVRPLSKMSFDDYQYHIASSDTMDVIEFKCMSTLSLKHASNYGFSVYSPAGWYEQVHKRVSTVKIYLPVDELRGEGKSRFESFLLKCCTLLRPFHGAAGLGIQDCHDWENYQTHGHETVWSYRGIDLCPPSGNKRWRDGYVNLNWYTFIAHHWLAPLGTPEELQAKLDDPRIALLPYEWGTVIRAGDWPALGKAGTDPRPELYVKVNDALRPLRVQDIGSLHYGTFEGEVQLNRVTSNLWLRRFDTPQEVRAYIDTSADHRYLRMPSGLPCPWPGLWICEQRPDQGQHSFRHAEPLPEVDGHAVTWRLVETH